MKEKKKSILQYFLYMILIFLVVDFANQVIPSTIGRIILYSKYGPYILAESLAIVVVFIVMMLSHNYYVFIQKHENFIKSIGVGAVMFGISSLLFLPSLPVIFTNTSNVISLAIFCLTIGIFEEFLCRGWLLNEFIERFSSNRKQVILSVVLSSLIFGGMHITNIWIGGQTVFETLLQIAQATALGIILGGIYFRTRNIWAVAFLHGFWDFAIMLSEVSSLRECQSLTPSTNVMIYSSLTSMIIVILYICVGLFILRPSKISPLIEGDVLTEEDRKKEERNKIALTIIPIIAYAVILCIPRPKNIDDFTICYDYEEKYLGDIDYHTSSYYHNTIKESDYDFIIQRDDDKNLVLKNNNTDESVVLYEYKEDITYLIEIVKNKDTYSIGIFEFGEFYDGTTLYYTDYVNLDNLSNSKEYLEQIKDSLIKFDLPTIKTTGYITTKDNDYQMIFGATSRGEYLFIDQNKKLYVLTDDETKKEDIKEVEETTEKVPTKEENNEEIPEETIPEEENLEEKVETE